MVSSNWTNPGCSSWRSYCEDEINICFVVFAALTRQVVFVVNGLNWLNRFTSTIVHALIGVNVWYGYILIDAVNRTFVDASFVLDIDTGRAIT